jgi:hypothetical protein
MQQALTSNPLGVTVNEFDQLARQHYEDTYCSRTMALRSQSEFLDRCADLGLLERQLWGRTVRYVPTTHLSDYFELLEAGL